MVCYHLMGAQNSSYDNSKQKSNHKIHKIAKDKTFILFRRFIRQVCVLKNVEYY